MATVEEEKYSEPKNNVGITATTLERGEPVLAGNTRLKIISGVAHESYWYFFPTVYAGVSGNSP